MAARDNLHSRVVGWLKVLLPLSALALLSTVFLVAHKPDHGTGIPFSMRDLKELASEQRLTDPVFSSVTDEGQRVVITADEAVPRDSSYKIVDAIHVQGKLLEENGETIDIRSDAGTLFSKGSKTILQGNVQVDTSSGYSLRTEEMIAYLDRSEMETTAPVDGSGPLGTIEADRMIVTTQEATNGAERQVTVVFKGRVKLVYTPPTQ